LVTECLGQALNGLYTSSVQEGHDAPRPTRSGGRSAKELAYDYVKSEVLAGRWPEGGFLTEEQVAAALGMSRTPVREAFARLEAEQLLELLPSKGALIRPISYREIVDVMEVRQMIEVFAARRLLERGADISGGLSRLLAEQRSLADRGDAEAFIECDRRFHTQIVAAAGNDLLASWYQGLRDRQLRMGIQAVVSEPARTRHVLGEHEEIVAAFDAGEADQACTAIEGHLRTTLDVLRAVA
jgi:DNA-binding GntR family transcriptional regulator